MPWLVDDQVAGYVILYDENGFQFVTVKGSGHMVSADSAIFSIVGHVIC